ncbi:MAG TPA: suppressor of fused domain protein [Jatrophihabitantaceae bacterium]|nr:suppressor of fused domain protein [Jatrophihabitantaceae bacterium]
MGTPDRGESELLALVERSMRAHYGVEPARASITFVGVEPIEILRFDTGAEWVHVSVGLSRQPMTGADAMTLAAGGPRAELSIRSRGGERELWRRLAVLAAAPTVEGVVYREGMTVDLGEPLVSGSRCTGVLVGPSTLDPVTVADVEVQILQLDAATATEIAWSRVHGTEALRERWTGQQIDLLDLRRAPVRLD